MPRFEFRAYISIAAENEDDARKLIEEFLALGQNHSGLTGELDESPPDVVEDDDE